MHALTYIAAALALILASARLTRAIVFDDFPPSKWIRDRWDAKTGGTGWNELFHCPYCMGVWVSLPLTVLTVGLTLGWGVFGSILVIWWVFLAWMAVAYLSGIIVATNWG